MNARILCFTDTGETLARILADSLQGEVMRCGRPLSLDAWTRQGFAMDDALIYIGATGIAVRAIAPYVRSKAQDPAVVVVDETGRFAISLLSGHLGGANELTERVAALCGATPVITTATDRHGVFAVDSWARMQGCVVENPEAIRIISSRMLQGERITVCSDWEIGGETPEGVTLMERARERAVWTAGSSAGIARCEERMNGDEVTPIPDCGRERSVPADVALSLRPDAEAVLRVIPRIAVLGIGCRRDIRPEAIERVFERVCAAGRFSEQAVYRVCSIDRKAGEWGLVRFCEEHGWGLQTYSAEELRHVEGAFSASPFVQETVGVDNVCERSAVQGSAGGQLILRKYAEDGVTMAVAIRAFHPDWRWR